MQAFIGREPELQALEQEYLRHSGFVVIYGRRRVGKTTLIKEFIKNKSALYFLATEEMERQSMKRFLSSVVTFTGQSYLKNANFTDWESIFQIFADYKPNEKKILIIDEFQYLVQVNAAYPSIFQHVWDEVLMKKNVTVILCGSLISMMTTHVLSYSSPLYGRRTAQIRLQPLKFTELLKKVKNRSFSELIELYALTGGVPKYLEFFENDKPLLENIKNNVLSKSGFLYEEPQFLLESEVREPVNYFSIIKTIAQGNRKLSEIAGALEYKGTSLTPYLTTLMDLHLVEKRVPVTEKSPEKSRKGLYFITDNFINFWFNFVYPYKGELELDNQEIVLEKLRSNFIDNFVSFIYEDVCKDIFARLCKEKIINFSPSKIGSYWNTSSNIEIDVVAVDNTNKKIFAGECKYYQNNPIDIGVYSSLIEKCKTPDFSGYKIVYGLFSKSGFSSRLIEAAKSNDSLILIQEDTCLTNSLQG